MKKSIIILAIIIIMVASVVTLSAKSLADLHCNKFSSQIGQTRSLNGGVSGRYDVKLNESGNWLFSMPDYIEYGSWALVKENNTPVLWEDWDKIYGDLKGTMDYVYLDAPKEHKIARLVITSEGAYAELSKDEVRGRTMDWSFNFIDKNGNQYFGLIDFSPFSRNKKGNVDACNRTEFNSNDQYIPRGELIDKIE